MQQIFWLHYYYLPNPKMGIDISYYKLDQTRWQRIEKMSLLRASSETLFIIDDIIIDEI